jgi:hypothetical protein
MYDESKLSTEEKVRQNRVMDSVLLKAKWAHDHIDDLDRACEAFFDTRPYETRTEYNAETRQYTTYFVGSRQLPREITGHVGDILYNLRSTLDHLAWQLVIASGKRNPGNGNGFPIFNPTSKESQSLFCRNVNGMRDDAIVAIARLKPYKGGNDTLWLLHELNRIDKHHEFLRIGASHIAQTATPSDKLRIENIWRGSHPHSSTPPNLSSIMIAVPVIRILEPNDVLRISPEADYDPNAQYQLEISFAVPGVLEGKSIINTLKEMERVVTGIVCDFKTDGHFRL